MNYLFGVWHFDGRPAEAVLTRMSAAVASTPRADLRLWSEGQVGFGVLVRHTTPEARFDPQPFHDEMKSFIASGRVDYRDELTSMLSILPPDTATLCDSELMLRAYRHWGADGMSRLYGDWACAAWDAAEQRLLLMRDQHGLTTLYYHYSPRLFAFASSLIPLKALEGDLTLQPNLAHAAHILTSFPPHAHESGYEGLHGLPVGHHLTVTPQGTALKRYYWLEQAAPVRFTKDDDYPQRLRELYTDAVRQRLRVMGRIGATLSGGLDSGSTTTLAARDLRERGERLTAYCSVPIHDFAGWVHTRFGDERVYAGLTAAHAGNVDLIPVHSSAITPLEGIRRTLTQIGEAGHAAGNWYWLFALAMQAQADDISTLLIGQFGNGTISWQGNLSVWDWLHHRRYKRAVVQPVRTLIRSAGRVRALSGADPQPYRRYSAIHPDFARRVDLLGRMRLAGHDPTLSSAGQGSPTRLLRPGTNLPGAYWLPLGWAHGLDVRDATLDRRVVEFCLGVPQRQFRSAEWNRWLIRRAMDGLMPSEIVWSRRRGLQSADLVPRLQADRAAMDAALNEVERSAAASAVVDVAYMRSVWKRLWEETPNPELYTMAGSVLLRGLGVGLFLAQFG